MHAPHGNSPADTNEHTHTHTNQKEKTPKGNNRRTAAESPERGRHKNLCRGEHTSCALGALAVARPGIATSLQLSQSLTHPLPRRRTSRVKLRTSKLTGHCTREARAHAHTSFPLPLCFTSRWDVHLTETEIHPDTCTRTRKPAARDVTAGELSMALTGGSECRLNMAG